MNVIQNIALVLIIFGFATAEYVTGRHKTLNATPDDGKLELAMFLSLIEMFYPLINSKRAHSALARGGRAFSEAETASSPRQA